jgi:dynein heavy chain, axonemal
VHARDIIEDLKREQVLSVFDFNWQKQLRYYYEEEMTCACVIRQIQATLNYGGEYMGATSRLVITPLTDKCWITITGALHIKLGANPSGPAGTGKTESTKDLAKAIAILCIVFNCSDQVDYILMYTLFSGLC